MKWGPLQSFVSQIGEISLFFVSTLTSSITRPFYISRLLEQIDSIGVGSVPLTIMIGLVTGLVMTLQFGSGLEKFGGTLYVPSVVSLSLVRELSPVFTSLLVGGRISSGITAEVGPMNVSEQVQALRALGTSPIRILVVPRFLATLLSLPLLTMLSLFFGYIGGYLIASSEYDMGLTYYNDNILAILKMSDLLGALMKTLVFAVIISILSCYRALNTQGGTKGVGESTQWAVVTSSLCILLADFFMSKFFVFLWSH